MMFRRTSDLFQPVFPPNISDPNPFERYSTISFSPTEQKRVYSIGQLMGLRSCARLNRFIRRALFAAKIWCPSSHLLSKHHTILSRSASDILIPCNVCVRLCAINIIDVTFTILRVCHSIITYCIDLTHMAMMSLLVAMRVSFVLPATIH
jgi:hypothetical protein